MRRRDDKRKSLGRKVEAEVRRLERLGARRKQQVGAWYVMEAPSGHVFCVVPVQSKAWPAKAVEWPE